MEMGLGMWKVKWTEGVEGKAEEKVQRSHLVLSFFSFLPRSLEKENYDVWAKVVRLSEELEKEKKKSAALEISLRNVERSREDVERRNKALEEDVKEFVKLMKEPKTDA